ncbi:hypothetical protein WMY93_001999 [Mugilogobius chulae]|uniref:Uncharacterized protein n=1 Tax=Mugilogobius chulae TaxID=88201 RepID=A0AAW0PSB1_9GOBI
MRTGVRSGHLGQFATYDSVWSVQSFFLFVERLAERKNAKPDRDEEEELFSELCRLEKHLTVMEELEEELEKEEKKEKKKNTSTWTRTFTSACTRLCRTKDLPSFSLSLKKVQVLKQRLREAQEEGEYSLPLSPPRRSLPWWCVYVAWLLVATSAGVCGYYTMLYGLKFGKEKSISWLVSMSVSFFQSLLLIQPLKVVGLAVFFALVVKKVDEEELDNVQIHRDKVSSSFSRDTDLSLYKPPPAADVEKMKRNREKEQKAYALLTEILVYVCFMWMLLLVAYGERDPNAFYLNQHILSSFSPDQDQSLSLDQVFLWTRTTLLKGLYGQYPGFITDGNSLLIGRARLRQVRVRGQSCRAPEELHFHQDCNLEFSWDWEDTGDYGPGWTRTGNGTRTGNRTEPGPWSYQSQQQLRAAPVWGQSVLYRGGGYVCELGPDAEEADRTLETLFESRWLDSLTRAVFAEFTVYNANVNLFCLVTLLLEADHATGAFDFRWELRPVRLYTSTGGLHVFVMTGQIFYMIFVLYYMYKQGQRLRVQRWSYFRDRWNLLELSIIALSWTGVGLFIQKTVLAQSEMDFYHNNRDKFPSFSYSASSDLLLQFIVAFLVLLSTVPVLLLLRLLGPPAPVHRGVPGSPGSRPSPTPPPRTSCSSSSWRSWFSSRRFPSFSYSASSDLLLQFIVAFLVLLSTVKLWHLLRLNPNMELISSALSRASGDITGFLLVIGLMFVAYATTVSLDTSVID